MKNKCKSQKILHQEKWKYFMWTWNKPETEKRNTLERSIPDWNTPTSKKKSSRITGKNVHIWEKVHYGCIKLTSLLTVQVE